MADLDPSLPAPPGVAPSADLLRLVAENLDVVFYVTTPGEGRVLYHSPAFETLYGVPPPARWSSAASGSSTSCTSTTTPS